MTDSTPDLARIDFDARVVATHVPETYRTWCEELDDKALDREIELPGRVAAGRQILFAGFRCGAGV